MALADLTPKPELKEKLLARVRAGEQPKAVMAELGINKNTGYVWLGRVKKKERADDPPIESVETKEEDPRPIRLETKEKPEPKSGKKGGAGKKRPLSEDSVERLVRLPFIAAALFTSEPIWLLTDLEAKELAGPGADSLAMIPNPIADAINTYAAPGEFAAVLISVIAAKRNAIMRKHSGATVAQPVRQPQVQPQTETRVENNATNQENEVAEAVAAAKGSLQELDEHSGGEELLR